MPGCCCMRDGMPACLVTGQALRARRCGAAGGFRQVSFERCERAAAHRLPRALLYHRSLARQRGRAPATKAGSRPGHACCVNVVIAPPARGVDGSRARAAAARPRGACVSRERRAGRGRGRSSSIPPTARSRCSSPPLFPRKTCHDKRLKKPGCAATATHHSAHSPPGQHGCERRAGRDHGRSSSTTTHLPGFASSSSSPG
eukprot:352202-Chlamydomonas_euryale.AAC.1